MNLKKLIKEVEWYIKGIEGWDEGSQPHTEGKYKLEAIKQTVEAVDKALYYKESFTYKSQEKDWQKLKTLLELGD